MWFRHYCWHQQCDDKPEVLLLYKKLQAYYSEIARYQALTLFIYKGLKLAEETR